MIKRVLLFYLILNFSNVSFGEGISKNQNSLQDPNRFANQQAEVLVNQLPDEIKLVDSPALRTFLRLRLAAFLWNNKSKLTAPPSKNPELIVSEALADLKAHEDEIPFPYAKTFRTELLALAQLHAPELATNLSKQYGLKEEENRDKLSIAYSMLREKNDIAAIKMVQLSIDNGQDPGAAILSFINQLQNDKPEAIPQVLTAIVAAAEQKSGTISLDTLFWLTSAYSSENIPLELRIRFADVCINAVGRIQTSANEDQLIQAYRLLSNLQPIIERSAPLQYQRSRSLLPALSARLPEKMFEQINVEERIKQSTDPLNQMIIEADATKDESLRDELLTDAAQLALSRRQLKLAIDLAAGTSAEGAHGQWRDQFLSEATSEALKIKDTDLAQYATLKISLPLNRAATLQKVSLYFFDAKDVVRARESLNEAVKLAYQETDNAPKIRFLLNVSTVFLKVDELRVTETVQASIKAINNIPKPGVEEKANRESQKRYIQTLTQIAWNVLPTFQSLAQKDYVGAFSLAKGISSREIRASAILGACAGILAVNNRGSKGRDD
jgi:hypothetical protein